MKQTSEKQVTDWLDHPEKYDILTDHDYAQLIAWTQVIAELNGLSIDQRGEATMPSQFDHAKMKRPTVQQVIVKMNELRGRPKH